MDNINLFDDLDFDEPIQEAPKKPAVEKKPEPKVAPTKEEITEAVKEVVQEIKPAMISSLNELFNTEEVEEDTEETLDSEDYLKSTTMEKLTKNMEVEIDGNKIVIEESEDGLYSILLTEKGASEQISILEDLLSLEDAVIKATDHILSMTAKKKPASKSKKSKAPTVAKKEEEPPYEGPRHIKVWGRELWTELDPKVTETQIVEKIARDFGLPEFREGKVMFDLDKVSGVLSVGLSFNKKG